MISSERIIIGQFGVTVSGEIWLLVSRATDLNHKRIAAFYEKPTKYPSVDACILSTRNLLKSYSMISVISVHCYQMVVRFFHLLQLQGLFHYCFASSPRYSLGFLYCRNRTSYENFKLKLCACAQRHALGTHTKFQIEILTINVISGIVYLREIILETKHLWNNHKVLDYSSYSSNLRRWILLMSHAGTVVQFSYRNISCLIIIWFICIFFKYAIFCINCTGRKNITITN